MKQIHFKSMLFILFFIGVACNKQNPEITSTGGALNYLSKPHNIGMIIGFNFDNSSATTDSINTCWGEAISAGMSAGRLQIDWPDIETSEGVYNKALVEDLLGNYHALGLQTHVLISAYDSEGPDVPAYLEGLDFDDVRIINSFKNLMDWVIPIIENNGGYAISVANEPDNAFQDNKKLVNQVLNFFETVRNHIHEINENIGVSITMNTVNLEHSKSDMKKIMNEVDYGCFNLYGAGLFPLDAPYSKERNEANIQEMLDFAGLKLIVIQELGMHSDTDLLNSSEEIQRDFFTTFFTIMENEERIKAAYIFQMVDWSPGTAAIISEAYEADTPQWFIDQYGRVLETLGMIDFETGERKLAWNEIIHWIEKFN